MRFKHMDMKDLEAKLIESKNSRVKLIVTDGVFSMDGDVAPLKDICDLADEHDAQVFIDECHATGFFGKTGRGTPEYTNTTGRIDIINSTLGKALGGASGGYTAGSKEVVTMLRQRSRPYLFSNTVAPPIVGASMAVFDMLLDGSPLVPKLLSMTHHFRDNMTKAGFKLRGSYDHPIVPIMLGDASLAAQFAELMLKKNIYVVGFSYPVVPNGLARIRTQISAAHSMDDINEAIAAFISVGKELKVIH
jgi:glycine C-acetyltransferase